MSSWSKSKPLTPMPKIVHGVDGTISREECAWLINVPKILGNGLYANLGVWCGRSVICLAAGLSDSGFAGKVIGIDTFAGEGMKGYNDPYMEPFFSKILNYAKDKIAERDLDSYVTLEIGLTSDIVTKYLDKKFVFIFIDADHSYEHVKEDFELWSPLLVPGGLLAFHDSDKEGVKRLLSELVGWKQLGRVDYITYWTKIQ